MLDESTGIVTPEQRTRSWFRRCGRVARMARIGKIRKPNVTPQTPGGMTMAQAFPLQWPDGWKRTPLSRRVHARYKLTGDVCQRRLIHSLELLGANRNSIVLSTNIPIRQDGFPYAQYRTPEDSGVAVYWVTKAYGERVMACDRWLAVHENIHAIGLAVEGLRAIERAGASQILERAFTAFGALPPSSSAPVMRPWWEVFEFPQELIRALSPAVIDARYREIAAKVHPDRTGSEVAMLELNFAREQAKQHFNGGP